MTALTKEMRVFLAFAEAASLVVKGAKDAMTPAPDIECDLSSGETIAFEITEAVESEYRQTLAVLIKTVSIVRAGFAAAPEEVREAVLARHAGKVIDVCFLDDEHSLRKREADLPAVFAFLANNVAAECGTSDHFADNVIEAGLPSPRLDHLTLQRVEGLTGIHWEAGGFGWTPGNPVPERFREKMRDKSYASPHPMELVVYIEHHVALPDDTGWIEPIQSAVESMLTGSPFRRAHLFDLRTGQVKFSVGR